MPDAAGKRRILASRLRKVLAQRGGWLVTGLFGALSVLIALFSLHMANVAEDRRAAEEWHVHALEVLLTAEEFRTSTFDILRGERGYLLTGREDFLRPYRRAREEAPRQALRLRELVRDNDEQAHRVDVIADRLRSFATLIDDTVELARRGDHDRALAVVRAGHGRRLFEDLQQSIDALESEERRLLIARRGRLQEVATAADRLGQIAAIANIVLFAFAAIAAVLAMRAQRRARLAMDGLQRLATVDELTGLPNRRHFMARLEEELARARRNGSPLCLATVDIDHFKRINDTHGHAGGDAVLQQLAPIIREKTRLGDSAARLGGEEFALILPNTNAHQAQLVCDRLRRAVAACDFETPDGPIRVTLSTGVALLHREDDSAALMRRSDEALYDAKAGGRNQVRLAA
jgi:diguanylate cyclase (GGDEF)-like protein